MPIQQIPKAIRRIVGAHWPRRCASSGRAWTLASARLVRAVRTLLVWLMRARRATRVRVRRLRVRVRRLAHPSARFVSDGGERPAYPADLVGGQFQGLQVGAQGREVDRRAGR
ncbi:hypothetical protein ABT255_59155 [Streptomyces mirabilis]|uniref:hypothetical protein n=1 Tax=Streptomyces mirabilis TaxID=68239 RepID=UPI00331F77B6